MFLSVVTGGTEELHYLARFRPVARDPPTAEFSGQRTDQAGHRSSTNLLLSPNIQVTSIAKISVVHCCGQYMRLVIPANPTQISTQRVLFVPEDLTLHTPKRPADLIHMMILD